MAKEKLVMALSSSRLRFAMVLVLLLSPWLNQAVAQGRQSGEIRGTVTDPSQAVMAGVTVTVTNASTGVSQRANTDAAGVYDFPYVAPGEYSIAFSKDAFKTFVRSGIVLHVQTITVNAALDVGVTSERVVVNAVEADVETETTDKNTRFTPQLIADAPTANRDWMDLLASLPGVNPGWGEGSSGQAVGVNGQAGFYSNWQIDGGIAMFGQSSNPDALAPPLDSIEEVDVNTANFGAEHGSGFSVFNVITKSGTNNLHGSVYEYIQNDVFNAANKFAQGAKPPVRWNEYGFNIGGPIKQNKAFFFFGYQRNPSNTSGPAPTTYPTTDYRNGNFSTLLGAPAVDDIGNPLINPCKPEQVVLNGQIYDPATTQTVGGQICRMPFDGNIIPKERMDAVALKVQENFPIPNRDGLFNNYYTNLSSPNTNTWFNGKVDYDVTPKNRLTGSFLIAQFNSPLNDQNCAINCGAWSGTESQAQITNVWTMSPTLVSEFRFSFSRARGIATVDNQGKGWPAQLGLNNAPGDLFPAMSMEGALNTGIGYTPFPPAIDAETTFVPSEVVTWVKGKHIFKFGGEFDRWWVNTGWGTATAGQFDFSGVFTQNPVDQALSNAPIPSEGEGYADFLLGAPDWWGVSINPETGGRMYSVQAFAQDEYKVKPNLTLTLGVRYVLQSGWSEVHNKLSTFQPDIMNPGTGTAGGMWYAGEQGRRSLTKTIPHFFSPRLGIAWAPGKNWSIRGGFGIYNIIAGQNITAPAQAWGQGWSPAGSLYDTTNPVFQLSDGPPPGAVIYPTAETRTPDLLNGSDINYSFYDSPMEYTMQYHVDVQHAFPGALVLDVGYVGNRGINLQYTRDLNQVPANQLGQGQDARPYPQFNLINAAHFDGWSNYNALQVTVKKQFSQGLLFQTNYSWAKALDTLTSAGWGGGGSADRVSYQNANDPKGNYGRAATDIRHMFNGNVVYSLPFGSGKRFLDQGGVVNGIVGGWQLSSIFQIRSGLPFSPIIGSNNSGAMSGTWRPNQLTAGTACDPTGTVNKCLNGVAFETPPANTFGNTGRDILTGPNWRTVDLALLKDFSLHKLHEGASLQFKIQATDVFNHPNLGFPERDYESDGFGLTSYANTSREMQLGMKISF